MKFSPSLLVVAALLAASASAAPQGFNPMTAIMRPLSGIMRPLQSGVNMIMSPFTSMGRQLMGGVM